MKWELVVCCDHACKFSKYSCLFFIAVCMFSNRICTDASLADIFMTRYKQTILNVGLVKAVLCTLEIKLNTQSNFCYIHSRNKNTSLDVNGCFFQYIFTCVQQKKGTETSLWTTDMSKWWHNFYIWVNYCFNTYKNTNQYISTRKKVFYLFYYQNGNLNFDYLKQQLHNIVDFWKTQ